MASVSGALRPCVLPRGAFLSAPRSRTGRSQSAVKALCSLVHGRSGLVTKAKWKAQRAPVTESPAAGCRTEKTLFSAIYEINQELLRSSHFSRSLSIKAMIGDVPSSTAEAEVVSKKEEESQPEDPDSPPNWTIKLLYDGDCPLCMKEVEFLRGRNKTYGTIRFVAINADSYSPQENAGLSYDEAMERIHGILRDGTILTGVAVFRKVYEEIGLGWVYAVTSVAPIGKLADALYDLWAKYRLPITGRPPLIEVLEARRQKKVAAAECDRDGCGVGFERTK